MGEPASSYVLHVAPGLEGIAAREATLSVERTSNFRCLSGFDERTSLLAIVHRGDPGALLALRTVEDVFSLVVDRPGVSGGYAGLREVREAVEQSDGIEAASTLALTSSSGFILSTITWSSESGYRVANYDIAPTSRRTFRHRSSRRSLPPWC
jgi:hypothetical protein